MVFAPVCVGMVLCCFVEATPAQTLETEAATISSHGAESSPPVRKPQTRPSPTGQDTKAVVPTNPSAKTTTATPSVTTAVKPTAVADTVGPASAKGTGERREIEEVMGLQTLGEITVSSGRANSLEGIATSASQGEVSNDDFKYRPLSRTGELVEVVPGMLSTQHSGTGKANQYFLRGFNLDHGTDFTTWIDGIPMNLRTNAHGQGYMDLNSLIPEMVDRIEFGKGPYYADQGDFSSAGYARMTTKSRLTGFNNDSDKGYALFEGGMFDYYRAMIANSNRIGDGDLLYAGELNFYNGPWVVPENGNKYNGMLKYILGGQDWQVALNGKAYYSHWTATNQIPLAQLGASLNPTCCDMTGRDGYGTDGRFGSMNPSDGGVTNRYSGSLNATSQGRDYQNQLNIYALYYDLDLWSDFSYFSANPYQGDQVYQRERRVQAGGNAEQIWFHKLWDLDMENKLGVQLRYDGIRDLGVSNTWNKQPVADNTYMPPSLYDVDETSLWFYGQNETRWTRWLRSQTAARSDTFWFDVQSKTPGFQYNAENSGATSATVLSPKFNLIFGPWEETELFVNSGYSYHSNDARGTVQRYNPDGSPTTPVTPLSWSRGAETGVRTQYVPGLNTTLAVWWLQMSGELVFVGDAGTTEPTGGTNRLGAEWTNFYKPLDWLTFDADLAFTASRYQEEQEGGCTDGTINIPSNGCGNGFAVPNAVGRVITAGVQIDHPTGFFGSLRLRSFGQDPLNVNASSWLGSTNIVNLGAGWHNSTVKLEVNVFNLFDSQANDIAYWYQYGVCNTFSTGQCGGAHQVTQYNGQTFHPIQPRMVRAGIVINF